MAYETVNRGWLKKQVLAGKVEAKCNHHLTDDYRFDDANNFGVTGWMPARIRYPRFEKRTLYNGIEVDHCADSDFVEGQMNFNADDFGFKSGGAYRNADGTIHFYLHSNASYDLRIVASKEHDQ